MARFRIRDADGWNDAPIPAIIWKLTKARGDFNQSGSIVLNTYCLLRRLERTMSVTSKCVHTGRMILTPMDPWVCPPRDPLIDALEAIGLLGGRVPEPAPGPEPAPQRPGQAHPDPRLDKEDPAAVSNLDAERIPGLISGAIPNSEAAPSYAPGPDFLFLIAFTGCAVSIKPISPEGPTYAQIRFPPPLSRPGLHQGRNTRPPRCPACRARLLDWSVMRDVSSRLALASVPCPDCGVSTPPWRWDWKQQGGFARRVIEVEEVFPGEAVPSPALLDRLREAGGCAWRFFYIQD